MRPTLEVKTYMQFDWYKKFLAHRGELTETYVRIESTSIGASLTYKAPMQQDLSLNIGLGYYKYNFNRIQNINSMHGISDARGTTFTDAGVFLAKRCDAYWYHTVDGIIGIEKRYRFKERMFAAGSISLHNYFSFSRAYHIDEELSQPGKENPYKRNGFKFFGLSATADVLVARSYGRFLLGPVLMIPVFKMWKKDSSFINEDDTGTRSHWFRGVAGGISLQYSL